MRHNVYTTIGKSSNKSVEKQSQESDIVDAEINVPGERNQEID